MNDKVWFLHGRYLGGAPDVPKQCEGSFELRDDMVGIWGMRKRKVAANVPHIASVEVTGGDVAKSRAGAAVMFGVGALAAKGSEQRTYVVCHMKSGAQIVFQIDKVDPMKARGKIGPWLQAHGIPFHDAVPVATQPVAAQTSVGDQLSHLAGLHAAGALTDAEFTAAKARILG